MPWIKKPSIVEQAYRDSDEREHVECYQSDGGDYFECCKCSKVLFYDEIALKHCAGEFECIDCYTKSMRKG